MFGKKKAKPALKEYDKENLVPIIRCSICNGEQVAGFKNIRTGEFHEIMFVRDDAEIQRFKDMYGLDSVKKEY